MEPLNLSLKNKTAIVTGSASGIGESIAKTFALHGANLSLIDMDEDKGQQVVQQIRQKGGVASFYKENVADHKSIGGIINDIYGKYKRIDILVNNAGIASVGTLESTDESEFDRVYSVNVKGVYNCMQAAIHYMKEQKQGVILNIGSVASELGLPDRFAYSMSKAAVTNMTLTVARDYIKHNIRCNSLAPARIHTPFVDGFLAKNYPENINEMFDKLSQTQPIGRMGKPVEVAWLALYLCSDAAAFITGTNFPIDGGFIRLNT